MKIISILYAVFWAGYLSAQQPVRVDVGPMPYTSYLVVDPGNMAKPTWLEITGDYPEHHLLFIINRHGHELVVNGGTVPARSFREFYFYPDKGYVAEAAAMGFEDYVEALSPKGPDSPQAACGICPLIFPEPLSLANSPIPVQANVAESGPAHEPPSKIDDLPKISGMHVKHIVGGDKVRLAVDW